ncbi:DMT family transporter [Microvirga terrae]|uniref:DMT family transporter n=1 Tax=Microvirga terrae TaxID=2740529 RepID=A0ABY5RPC1_9HYPH|nr:DMT family transporter [Microvirga terrae]UVF19098.1 DMT family transporter [Microvirga terrae]
MAVPSTTARLEPGVARAFAALCLGAVAMGISPIFVRFASAGMDGVPADVGPFASAFWRVSLCLPLLYAWMRIEERRAPAGAPKVRFSKASVFGGIVFAGDLLFWHLAILKTTVANATFFATMAPLFVVLIVWLVLRQQVSRGTFMGLALCLLGGAALIGQSLQADPARIEGDLYGLATAFFFGLYFLAASRARKTAGAAQVTFEAGLITSAILLVVALLFDTRVVPRTAQGIAALLAMSYVSHAGGQGLLAIALGRLPAVFSSLVIFLEAIAAAVFGWAILGEALTPVQSLGGALILFGIWIARPKADTPGG